MPRQLPVHPGPVRLRPPNPRRRRRRIQRRFQPPVVQLVRQRPRDSRLPRPPDVAADRAVGDPEHGGNLPVAPAESVLQPENISNLAHGQPLLGHRLPPRLESRAEAEVRRAPRRRQIAQGRPTEASLATWVLTSRWTRLDLASSPPRDLGCCSIDCTST